MSKINETPEWAPEIYRLTTEADVLGFDAKDNSDGPSNVQAEQLANRTQYLKQRNDLIDDRLLTATGDYTSETEAQAAINSGTEKRQFFNVMMFDNNWVERYENIDGIARPTGVRLPNSKAVDNLNEELVLTNSEIIAIRNLTKYLNSLASDKIPFAIMGEGGPSTTALAIDDNYGLLLAGLSHAVQEYLEQNIPRSLANRYHGLQFLITTEDGKKGLFSLDDDGGARFAGMDDVIQERVGSLVSSQFSRRIVGYQFVILTSNLTHALLAIDDDGGLHLPGIDGALQDALGQSAANIGTVGGVPALFWQKLAIWSERPVLTAQKLQGDGAIFTYVPGGAALSGNGVIYKAGGRELPIEAPRIIGFAIDGQSLAGPFDASNGFRVNRDARWRGRVLGFNGGVPEGNDYKEVTQAMLDAFADLYYPTYRQGQNIPICNALMEDLTTLGGVLPSIIVAPANGGGRSFAQIKKGTVFYTNGLKYVERIAEIGAGVGKPTAVEFLLFEHGETDNDNGDNPNPGDYLAKMVSHFNNRQVDYKALTGQSDDMLIVVDQVGSRINTKASEVDEEGNPTGTIVVVQPYSVSATDQVQYVRNNTNTSILSGSKWPLNRAYTDGTLSHLNKNGKILQGEYVEQAVFWHLYNPSKKGTWKPLMVKSISLMGNVIDLTYHVPFPPLVIDTATFGDCPGRGYALQNGSATVQTVAVVGTDMIRITFDQAPASTDHLLIGFTNTVPHENGWVYPLVCLRDSSQQKSRWLPDGAATIPLYNWAVLERISLTSGV